MRGVARQIKSAYRTAMIGISEGPIALDAIDSGRIAPFPNLASASSGTDEQAAGLPHTCRLGVSAPPPYPER